MFYSSLVSPLRRYIDDAEWKRRSLGLECEKREEDARCVRSAATLSQKLKVTFERLNDKFSTQSTVTYMTKY
jgi:hypothetical protein